MSYRPVLTGRALGQFSGLLSDHPAAYAALMERLARLAGEPWDAWPMQPRGDEPEFRQAQFGEYGLLSFRLDEDAETLIIFNILWAA